VLLDIKNLWAGYGEFEVLRGVSLEVSHGEAVCLIGPNGAGKSTVLKSVMNLTSKTRGEIVFRERNITKLPTHSLLEEGLSFVPQGRLVFPSLTVEENLEMGGYLINHKETLFKNLENVFSTFPVLKTKSKHRAGLLSGGEQQMLTIGRALMTSPELLMLDEPSLGLSPKVTREVFEKLREINAAGTTLLIVEQNVRLVLKYVSRGYLLASGEVHFAGSSSELSNLKLLHEAYLL